MPYVKKPPKTEREKERARKRRIRAARERSRRIRAKIRADPVLYEAYKKRNRELNEEAKRIREEALKNKSLETSHPVEEVNIDDDVIVVIVGDEEGRNRRKQQIQVKEEIIDQDELLNDIIENAEKYGELIPLDGIKQETNEEYLEADFETVEAEFETEEDEFQTKEPKFQIKEPKFHTEETEFQDEEPESQTEFAGGESDEEYVPNENEDSDDDEEEEKPDTEILRPSQRLPSAADRETHRYAYRYKMRPPEEQKSFVKELCNQYPELAADKELLIETLCEVMMQIKPPEPPQDYFVMNDINYECATCGAVKDTVPAIGRHWQEKHGPRYLVCFACGVDFRSKTNLYKHEKRCSAKDTVVVLQARARFVGRKGRSRPFLLPSDVAALRLKVKRGSNDKARFICSQCPAEFASRHTLQSHEFAHQGKRPYQCHLCNAAYTSHTALNRHQHSKHGNEKFICDHCSRSFTLKSALIQHLAVHEPVRKYACEICGQRYAQQLALKLHVDRVHYNLPAPQACQFCPKRYPRMSLLKAHMLRVHGMNLITRNMFYKALPHLSESQIQQAKVVMKADKNSQERQTYDFQELFTNEDNTTAEPVAIRTVQPVANTTAQPVANITIVPVSEKSESELEPNIEFQYEIQTEVNVNDMPEIADQQKQPKEITSEVQPISDNAGQVQPADWSSKFMDYVKQFQEGKISDNTKMIIIQDGVVTHIDDSNMHLYQEQLNLLENEGVQDDFVVNKCAEEDNKEVIQIQIQEQRGGEQQSAQKKRLNVAKAPTSQKRRLRSRITPR